MVSYSLIHTQTQLKEAALAWNDCKELAIDLECENNLHHYGTAIALVQISSGKEHWIIDTATLLRPEELIIVLENPEILKVFHDVDYDFRMLKLHWNCHPKNIFDTKIASLFLGRSQVGLGSLLEDYFGLHKQSKFQRHDWLKRPLHEKALAYAIQDVTHLLALKNKISNTLEQQGRYTWVLEECKTAEEKDYTYKEQEAHEVKGYSSLTLTQQAVFDELYRERNRLAKHVNRPPFFVISNKHLIALAEQPPRTTHDWKTLHGVHPTVKEHASQFIAALERARHHKKQFIPRKKPKRYNEEEHRIFGILSQARLELSERLKLPAHLLISKEATQSIIKERTLHGLKEWQERLFRPYLKEELHARNTQQS